MSILLIIKSNWLDYFQKVSNHYSEFNLILIMTSLLFNGDLNIDSFTPLLQNKRNQSGRYNQTKKGYLFR